MNESVSLFSKAMNHFKTLEVIFLWLIHVQLMIEVFISSRIVLLRWCLHEKIRTGASFKPGCLFVFANRVHMMTGSFHILLFQGTLHVGKVHVWFKIANITHSLPFSSLPADGFHNETGARFAFTWYRFEISYWVKFSPRYKNRGELTPGWLAPAWNLWCYHVNKYRAMRGNRSELAPGRKSPGVM